MALLVNGMTPYLGLKTQVSFSMYSNLRTEEEGWNHLFLPRALRVFGYQDSLVQVLDVRGTDGDLAWWADTGSRTVPFELRRALGDACESGSGAVSLTLAIAGDTLVAAEACRPPVLGGPNPALAEKLLLFRPVPPSNQCVH